MITGFGIIVLVAMLLGYDLLKDNCKRSVPRQLTEEWSETAISVEEAYEISDRNNKQGFYTEIITVDPEKDTFKVRMLI